MDLNYRKNLIENAFAFLDRKIDRLNGSYLTASVPIYMLGLTIDESRLYAMDITADEIGEKLNAGVLVNGDSTTLHAMKAVTYKEIKRACKFYPYLIKHDVAVYNATSFGCLFSCYYGSVDNKKWKIANTNNNCPGEEKLNKLALPDKTSPDEFISLASQLQFDFYLEDFIQLEKQGKNPIRFPTTPEASKELLKLREIEEGKRRRSHLINWVTAHYRATKSKEIKVKKHLRGVEKCKWLDYDVTIFKNI